MWEWCWYGLWDWTALMTDPDEHVHHLPTPKHPRSPHVFGAPVWIAADHLRFAQTERTCAICKVVKITVHAPDGSGWREWRLPDCADQYVDAIRPNCLAASVAP